MTKKRKICVVTGSRAEYGIMSGLMKALAADKERVELQIVATNMHLSPEYGMTVNEIEADGLRVDKRVEMLLSSDTRVGTVKSMGLAMIGLADAFEELKPDVIVLLGDRYEMLAAASAAQIFGTPVAHLHGGEITEGAYDDAIRHAITKLATLHFTATKDYRRRVVQMGEQPDRVFWTGAPGAANITDDEPMMLSELEQSLGEALGEGFLLVTFHPVTREPGDAEAQTGALLQALTPHLSDRCVLMTMPNSDTGSRRIAQMIEAWAAEHPGRVVRATSLGRKRYFAAVGHCAAVVGNSSSGLCEVPSLRKPTLNIGNRQRGRTRGNTVVDCEATLPAIAEGLERVLSNEFQRFVSEHGENPYYKSDTIKAISEILATAPIQSNQQKHFHDIDICDR